MECVLYELKAFLLLKGSITSWWFQIEEQDFGRQSTSKWWHHVNDPFVHWCPQRFSSYFLFHLYRWVCFKMPHGTEQLCSRHSEDECHMKLWSSVFPLHISWCLIFTLWALLVVTASHFRNPKFLNSHPQTAYKHSRRKYSTQTPRSNKSIFTVAKLRARQMKDFLYVSKNLPFPKLIINREHKRNC